MPGVLKTNNSLNKRVQSISNGLISFSAFLFILFYLVLSFYNRPTNEDVNFISIVKGKSLFEFVNWFYSTWCGRWASSSYYYIILSATSVYQHIHYIYFIYYVLTLCLFIYSLHTIIQIGINKLFLATIDTKTSLTFSLLFIAGFYFSTFQNIEVWWWIFSTVDHLQGIIILLLGSALLMKQKKSNWHFLLICICFIYVGGSYEINAMIIGVFFLVTFIYLLRKKITWFSDFRKQYFFKRFIIVYILFLLSFLISISSSGNQKRSKTYVRDHLLITTQSYSNTDFPITVNEFAQKKYLAALGLASLWFLLGMKLKRNYSMDENKKHFRKIILFACLPLLLSIIITYLFQVLFLSYYSIPLRGWTFTSFSLFALCCLVFLIIGNQIHISNPFIKSAIAIVIPFVVSLFLLSYLYKQYSTTSMYAREYDKLITQLIEAKNNKEIKVLTVDPLPDSGMLLPLEIGTKYIDDALKEILEFDYEIKVKK